MGFLYVTGVGNGKHWLCRKWERIRLPSGETIQGSGDLSQIVRHLSDSYVQATKVCSLVGNCMPECVQCCGVHSGRIILLSTRLKDHYATPELGVN